MRVDAPRGSALLLDRDFTLDAWISQEKVGGYNTDLIGFEDGWRLWLGGHTNILYFDKAGKFGKLRVGEWTHVAVSCSPDGEIRFYIDGEPAPRPAWRRSGLLSTGNKGAFLIGCLTHGPEPRYQGRCAIDEVRIWSPCLSGDAVRAVHDKGLTGTVPGLVAYWGFDEGAGKSAASRVPGSPAGVLGSMPRGEGFSRVSPPQWTRGAAPVTRVPAGGEIEVSSPSVDFGAWELTRGPTEPKSILIRNASETDLNVFQVAISGPDADSFRIVSDSGETSLEAGRARDVRIAFVPAATGARSATVLVMSTDPDEGLVRIPLAGEARCRRPPPQVAGPVPVDGATDMKHWMYLSWLPAPGADRYDVYLWPDSGLQSGTSGAGRKLPGRRRDLPAATVGEAR
ncbi:MAG: LamG-like jellyroll fold domain-containing protein, partial [Planctomycetota bacterium]